MASSKDFLNFVLDQLSGLDGISYRAMMGEYILYYKDKVIGGIYDNNVLIKPVDAALELMPDCFRRKPYEGAKEMLLVDKIDNSDFLEKLIKAIYPQLPAPKPKKKK